MATSTSLKSLFDLRDQVAVVTGGSRGLGFQVAEALAEFGANLMLVARKEKDLHEAAEMLRGYDHRVECIAADLTDPAAAKTVTTATLDHFGRIDILVNNAGATWGAPAEEYPLDAWQKLLSTNLTGPFLLTQEIGRRAMIPSSSGCVVNIASVAGLQGHHHAMVGTIGYNATKGAMVNFTRALAAEWGQYGIRVNALAPGFFPSKMTKATLERYEADLISRTPLGKLGGNADLKGAALLFASDAGSHITGQVLTVDGGAIVV